MNVNDCIVLIPYHKNDLNVFEKFSLRKGLEVLKNHCISFICPQGLDISVEYQHIRAQRFDEKYFQSLRGYNQLLLSEFFYKEFLPYKYILIYQLDALVFKDELTYWISQEYDYYGAPWNNKTWNWKYFNLFGLMNRKVGNGGFSLRKTAVFYEMAKKIRWIAKYIKFGEDIFWCNYGNILHRKFNVLPPDLATKFAFESEPEKLFHTNGNKLPFGCHAYEKNNLPFWREIIFDFPGK